MLREHSQREKPVPMGRLFFIGRLREVAENRNRSNEIIGFKVPRFVPRFMFSLIWAALFRGRQYAKVFRRIQKERKHLIYACVLLAES